MTRFDTRTTEERRAEPAVDDGAQRYRAFFDGSPQGAMIVGLDGRIREANDAKARMHGYGSPAELVGLHVTELVAPSSRERATQVQRRRLAGEDVSTVEYELLRKDGTTFPAEICASILRDEGGNILGYADLTRDLSEERRAARELTESRQLLASIVEHAPLMIFLKQVPGLELVLFNKASEELVGVNRTDILGKSSRDLFPAEQAAFFEARDREALEGEIMVDTPEEPISTAHKGTRLLHTRKVCVKGSDGARKYLLGISEDITERRAAETLLRESEERFRLLVEKSALGVYLLKGGMVAYTNESCAAVFGYTPEEVIGKLAFQDLIHPDDLPAVAQRYQERMSGEREKASTVYKGLKKDGSTVFVEVYGIRFEQKGEAGVIGSLLDVTEKTRAKEALEKSEERFKLGMEATSEGLWDWNTETGEVYYSPAAYRMLGYEVGSVLGTFQAWQDLLHPDDVAHTVPVNLDCLEGRCESFSSEYRLRAANGEWRWILGRGKSISRDERGRSRRLVGTNLDITERKRAEQERAALEEQLRASQKLESLGSLAGGVAHDFNNLLSVIQCYTDFAMEAMPPGDPGRDDLREVKQASVRAEALTRQLLAFSRKQVQQLVSLDLNQVVLGVEKMLHRLIGENVELTHRLAPHLSPTLADPGQIEQVLVNLVVNARDAMPRGGRCTIETSNVDAAVPHNEGLGDLKPGPHVRLAVSDTGTGMDEATKARVFEPFFTTKEKGKGTGLGLSTVYGIIRQSGGNIEIDSELGRGTTFSILLPRHTGSAAVAQQGPSATTPQRSGAGTVLVVDDEAPLRNAAARSLRAAGYAVMTASDGEEALARCVRHAGEIQLVLTDVVMPKMSGKELADRLATVCPSTKVLFMSGYTDDSITPYGVLDAGVRLVNKPFASTELVRAVRELLQEQ